MKVKTKFAFLSLVFLSSTTFAAIENKTIVANIEASLSKLNITADEINETKIKGLFEVIDKSNIYYLSQDGNFLINGNIYDIGNKMQNITAQRL